MSDAKEPVAEATPAVMETTGPAARYEARERSLTKMQSIKESKISLLWCMYTFFICIMWGFDGLAGGIVISIAKFREDFGTFYQGAYVVDADWQLGWLAGTLSGLIFGGWISGILVDKIGRQLVLLGGYVISAAGVFAQVFATTPAHFFAGKLLTGIPLGVFTTAAPPYASEMAPLSIRGSVSAGMNFAIVVGQLIGYGVMRETSLFPDSRQYKVLFATQWGFVAVAIAVLPFFPESPYWLMSHGKEDKARKNLEKLYGADHDFDGHLASISASLSLENANAKSQGNMLECFNKDNWRRTLVGTSMFFIQNCTGSIWVIGYMSYFMQLGGMSAARSFDTTVGLCGLMVVGNMFGWYFVDWFGRRATAFWGTIVLAISLILIGVIAVIDVPGAIWGQVGLMAVWSFVYQATLGAVAWPITAENATSRLRAPTQALATMMNGLSNCIWSFALPYAINPDQGNLGGKIAFIFGSVLVLSAVYIFFMIPETKGRTYAEIDELWARGIPPRKFKETVLVTIASEGEKAHCAFDSETIASCRRCLVSEVPCTFLTHRNPRGPLSRRVAEARLRSLQPPPSPEGPPALPSVPITISHLVPETSFQIILEDYYTRVHPLLPLVHLPTFKRRIALRHFEFDHHFLRLCICLCAATAASIPRRFNNYNVHWYADTGQLVDRASHLVLVSRLTTAPRWQLNASLESILESVCLSVACFYTNKPTAAWAYSSEATHFFRDLSLCKKEAYARYGLIEQELCKRAFWLIFIVQAHDRLSNVVPHTGLSYDPLHTDWEFLIPLELPDEELEAPRPTTPGDNRPLPAIAGFNALIKVFVCSADLMDEAFPGSPASYSMGSRALAPSLLPELVPHRPPVRKHPELPILDLLFHLMSQLTQVLNGLPEQLRIPPSVAPEETPKITPPDLESGHFEIMKVNIHITSLYVQSIILETCLNKLRSRTRNSEAVSDTWSGCSPATSSIASPAAASTNADLWTLREMVAKELLHIVSSFSMWVLESNGSSLIMKIREIAATLLEGEDSYDSAIASDAERRSREYVAQFVDILARLDYMSEHQFSALHAS